jgi:hypothetical protein
MRVRKRLNANQRAEQVFSFLSKVGVPNREKNVCCASERSQGKLLST